MAERPALVQLAHDLMDQRLPHEERVEILLDQPTDKIEEYYRVYGVRDLMSRVSSQRRNTRVKEDDYEIPDQWDQDGVWIAPGEREEVEVPPTTNPGPTEPVRTTKSTREGRAISWAMDRDWYNSYLWDLWDDPDRLLETVQIQRHQGQGHFDKADLIETLVEDKKAGVSRVEAYLALYEAWVEKKGMS